MNPLSAMFGMGVWLRNRFYDRGILKSHALSHPVVSIGNISVGGSGKTPFIIALGRLLKERGIAFDVLSRGYGRKSREVAAVDPDGPPEQFGDEPLLIAHKLAAPVVVGADRYQAGLLAEARFPQSKLHLLDDGFQHRRLHRDFDIVLLQPDDFTDTLLPLGRLRENIAAAGRADAIAIQPGTPLSLRSFKNPAWQIRKNIHFSGRMSRVVAFCGIARAEQFFAGLRKLDVDLAQTISFPDHHRYTQLDIDRLLKAQVDSGAEGFVTTEKDEINLGSLISELPTFETAGLELELENSDQALGILLRTLERRCGCRL